ncbi:methyltransferase domain-containing protein [Luteolibacter pohnpeiensis]|uniref:Methyltransferase domain-containing protein n=1 Tax=Luteolibacter pohnpeiensis TaxID=454153 RepID=A0A934S8M3_9BACT|nr:methyltransferase domain-containing protein [Luteolibacter pohnpeiensis]MBK1883259.1 methyltransferase domain-containing protein [Luteolibacter pohnpeiensis]
MDWNSRYANQDTPWNKGTHTPVLEEFLARHAEKLHGKVAVPGCGAGHDCRWLAEIPDCEVSGFDIAPLAIEEARGLDVAEKVSYRLYDFLNPCPDDTEGFDLLWEHTCFCALEPSMRDGYLKTAATLLKPGGRVAGVFFINPEMDEGEQGPPFKISVEELKSAWDAAGFEILDSWTPTSGYDGRIGRELALMLRKRG